MAKLFVSRREPRPIKMPQHVRDIRSRYARALAAGYSPADATRIANEGIEIVPAKRQTSAGPPASATAADRPPETVSEVKISGQATAPFDRGDIPPNWQDLPWPQLRELASRISDRANIRSRTEAQEIVEKALQS